MKPELTIGMATYRDYDGVYFTLQALRLYQDLSGAELLVVDNFGCEATRDLVEHWAGGRYVLSTETAGTAAPRDRVFAEARGAAVLCLDAHVLLVPGAVARLKRYYGEHPECRDLLQGPLVYDDLRTLASHFDPVWRDRMWGVWAIDERAEDVEGEPFDIPMQGLGLFSCRKAAWPGFHPAFRGFGGEEGYIHQKFRNRGGRCLCLPWLRWCHRFRRPGGVPYRVDLRDRLTNYLIGHRELGLDERPVLAHFSGEGDDIIAPSVAEADKVIPRPPAPAAPPAEPARALSVLGCWYTNNDVHPQIMRSSLASLAAAQSRSRHEVHVRTCSWEEVPENPFRGCVTHFRIAAHLGIAMQILRILYEVADEGRRPDLVCFLEHDVLYPEDYFERLASALIGCPDKLGVSNLDYMGMNQTGWCDVTCRQEPMHQLALRLPFAREHLEHVQRVCIVDSAANLEPEGKGALVRLPWVGERPSVHINHSRHFTSHFNCYARHSGGRTFHPYWGDFRKYYPEGEQQRD